MQSEELYYDHYKDTFERQLGYLAERNKLTLYLIFLVAIIFLMGQNRPMMVDVSTSLQVQNIGKALIDFNIISAILYFVFMWLALRYYQVTLTIERSYDYIHHCEEELSKSDSFKIDREGGNYLKDYPCLKSLAHMVYVYLFPGLVIVVSLIGVCRECGNISSYALLNVFFLVLVILITILYLVDRINNK